MLDDIPGRRIDDRLGVEQQPVVVERLADPAHPGDLRELVLVALLLLPQRLPVAERDDRAARAAVRGERRGADHRAQP